MRTVTAAILCFFLMAVFLAPAVSGLGGQAWPPKSEAASKASLGASPAPPSKEVVPGPRSPKEQVGVYVFIAWLWVAIIVLIFILRAKVREADRLFRAGYFRDKPPES